MRLRLQGYRVQGREGDEVPLKKKLLIIDDDQVFCAALKRHLEEEYAVTGFSDPEEAAVFIKGNPVDVLLTDLNMPKMDGLKVLKAVKACSPDTDVIVMTAYANVDSAVEAMKKGAYDYIVKPFSVDELSLQLKNLFEKRRLSEENVDLRKFIDLRYRPENIVGRSAAMKEVHRFIERVSQTDVTVLITGESGTGKELVARALHFAGKRKDRRFVSVHCGAMPQQFLEDELFGSEAGSPPEAGGEKGPYGETNRGTLVLSEIGDMDLSLQAKLIGAFENRDIRKGRGFQEPSIDVMVIATTNKDLNKLMQEGKFRHDLFHRLNMFSLMVPPLRERKEDIPLLADHFLSQYRNEFGRQKMRLSQPALEVLLRYDWPGNVRELKNLLGKICLLEDADVIKPEHLLQRLPKPQEEAFPLPVMGRSLGDVEKNLIAEALKRAGGNVSAAARLLNISYDTFRYRMKKFGLEKRSYRSDEGAEVRL